MKKETAMRNPIANMPGNSISPLSSRRRRARVRLSVSRRRSVMIDIDVEESVCPQDQKTVVYFDDYEKLAEYARVIPSASANIAYFEPGVQKWAMVAA
jgi:hypothetical protein